MTVRVITGSKQQIAQQVSQLSGEVREAIVFIDDQPTTSPAGAPGTNNGAAGTADDFFAEMAPYMADVGEAAVDDSREAIYDHREGE
jgi:hypothetical protein